MSISHVLRAPMAGAAAALLALCPVVTTAASAEPAAIVHMAPTATASGIHTLGIATAPNARDIGGYPTQQGGMIRYGQVFRSDALNKLTAADQQALASHNIGTVLDFRSPNEVKAAPDQLPSSISYQALPVWNPSNDFYLQIEKIIDGGPQAQQANLGGGKGVALMSNYYRWMVTDATARAQFATAIKDLAHAPSAVLYHCTAGKDRTGWMTALVMTALGVPRGLIYNDYLASNQYLAASNQAELAALQKAGLVTDPSLLAPILGVQRDFLDAAFDQASRSFGSLDGFLSNGLGIDAATRQALTAKLVDSSGH
ncbi:protein-tyrosine phosphatase [Nocardia sp. GAS34]|jgi:protein-tyrosine phosphatase|uniref:tyrosine-protein phosphatase n=1 Tax=unclassified Nocardia TaxID=2637762 RepID=UPI003D1D7A48